MYTSIDSARLPSPTADIQAVNKPQCKEVKSRHKFGDMFVKLHDVFPEDLLMTVNNEIEEETDFDFNKTVDGYPRSTLTGWKYVQYTELKSIKFRKLSLRIPEQNPPFYCINLVKPAITGLRLDDSCEIMDKECIVEKLRQNVQSDAVIDLLFSGIKKMAVESQLGGCTINIKMAQIARYPVTKELTSDQTKHMWRKYVDEPHKTNIIMRVTMNEKNTDAGCGYEKGEIITAFNSGTANKLKPKEETMEPHDVSIKNSAILQTCDHDLIFRLNNARLVGNGDLAEKRELFIWINVDNDQAKLS